MLTFISPPTLIVKAGDITIIGMVAEEKLVGIVEAEGFFSNSAFPMETTSNNPSDVVFRATLILILITTGLPCFHAHHSHLNPRP